METANSREAHAGFELVDDIEAELRRYESEERRRMGIQEAKPHWRDTHDGRFAKDERAHTTLLFGGLTDMHDALIAVAMKSQGYHVKTLACTDNEALQYGKEFGNRGQCNPTYYTSGNLLKYLIHLRDSEGWSTGDIIKRHVFFTYGACGPCRFGAYVTEYRKVLRDAGFEGFRVLDFKKRLDLGREARELGLAMTPGFYLAFLKAVFAADIINLLGYRTRPYEVVAGATDEVMEKCKAILCDDLANRCSVLRALKRCRKRFAGIEVDRLRSKPKVALIGEFWAMTTEGEGNYRLQRFLEDEGAECEIQLLTTWLVYELWCLKQDSVERMMLRRRCGEGHRSEFNAPVTTMFLLGLGIRLLKRWFDRYARAAGLNEFELPDMNRMAQTCREWYPHQLYGGEGHLEVGKAIDLATKNKVHMVISVKPFGCMPSSGVSDGIQSLVHARFPQTNFCVVETTGDAAVSVYSRVQMALYKARARAREEFESALKTVGLTLEEAASELAKNKTWQSPIRYPAHVTACTAANTVLQIKRGTQ